MCLHWKWFAATWVTECCWCLMIKMNNKIMWQRNPTCDTGEKPWQKCELWTIRLETNSNLHRFNCCQWKRPFRYDKSQLQQERASKEPHGLAGPYSVLAFISLGMNALLHILKSAFSLPPRRSWLVSRATSFGRKDHIN